MHDTNSALFASYILFVYFNGQNIARIEREMRALGYARFHRRILYPRADKPGWIIRYGWTAALTGAVGVPPAMSPKGERRARRNATVRKRGDRAPDGEFEPRTHTEGTDLNDAVRRSIRSIRADPCLSVAHSHTPDRHARSHSRFRPEDASQTPPTAFPDWLSRVSPNMTWSWRHQQIVIEQLERVTRGECKRLMIFLPPRHGKSELVTVRYTAWRMQRDPAMNVILGSYNQRLADRFSRKIRKVISDSEVGQTFQSVPADESTIQHDPANLADHSQEGRLAPAGNSREERTSARDRLESLSHTSGGKPAFPTATGQVDSARRTISRGEPSCSPFPFISSKPANSVSEWETTRGGGFRSVGVGSGVTGFGASLIVIDDPIKSRAEAESETYRERVWDWFTDDLYTRLEPDGAIVLIQTRWHEDDLAGRLLREAAEEGGEDWDVVDLPAIADHAPPRKDTHDSAAPLKAESSQLAAVENISLEPAASCQPSASSRSLDRRLPGEPLCPERFDLSALKRIRRRLGEYSFAALYQQCPTPAEGGLFKREWFKKIIPFAPPGLKWKRGYDLAVSTRTNADYTASFRCAFDKEGNLYISGGFRARLEYPDQRRFIIDRVKTETDTEHGIELALHGQALIQDLRRERGLRGHLLRGVKVEYDKYTRALTWAPLAEEGKVILVRNSAESGQPIAKSGSDGDRTAFRSPLSTFRWIEDFLDEVCSFPSAAHDDQVDAVSLAVQMLKGSGKRAWGF